METDNIIVFLDLVGRTLFAEEVPERSNEDILVVKNPVVVNINGLEGKMSLQLLPVFFKEFLADKDDDMVFNYNKRSITMADKATFDHKLYNNYRQMFSNIVLPPTPSGDPAKKVINLFDDEKSEK